MTAWCVLSAHLQRTAAIEVSKRAISAELACVVAAALT